MSQQFTKAEYDVSKLLGFIESGYLGLPDLQRPFVWPNTKVRDLFDSMYSGYPVGHLLFWDERRDGLQKSIGEDKKQKSPSLLILDGQQRLTSLYAVMKGKRVLRSNYKTESITIAFNPLTEVFKVADASTAKNKFFVNDISLFFTDPKGNHKFIEKFFSDLKQYRTLSEEQEIIISNALGNLWALNSYMFTSLELVPDIDEEAAAEIFVRVNSKGTVLKQADFILTLMSVHWNDGRMQLEEFCKNATKPGKVASSYNHFIEPSPDQMLRVVVGYGFKRARLKYVYQILKGKNLETGEITVENRNRQFYILTEAQKKAINLQDWQDYLRCIANAGFRNRSMISSPNTLLYCYTLYLIGKWDHSVDHFVLQRVIAQWFFMASITMRYTSSAESQFDQDLSSLPENKDPNGFVQTLQDACNMELGPDFWNKKVPNELKSVKSMSPAFCAYQAALVLHNAKAFFSDNKVEKLLDPALIAKRAATEKHHLFPKEYLKTIGIDEKKHINQVANLAMTVWDDNMKILDTNPRIYLPDLAKRFDEKALENISYWHALPDKWETMNYFEFLEARGKKIAQVIKDAYNEHLFHK